MSERYLTSGFDFTANPAACITRAQLLQSIQAAVPYATNKIGFVKYSDTAPNVVADPSLAYFLWLKTVAGVPSGEIYYYKSGSWTLILLVDGSLLATGSVALNKLTLSGAAALNIIQVNALATGYQFTSIASAIVAASLGVEKLTGGTSGSKVLTSIANSNAWMAFDTFVSLLTNGSVDILKLTTGTTGNKVLVSIAGVNQYVSYDALAAALGSNVVPQAAVSTAGGTSGQARRLTAALAWEWFTPNVNQVCTILDSRASGTAGDNLLAASAWATRVAQTIDPASGFGTLASNAVTLPAGTYTITALAAFEATSNANHQIRLYNQTAAAAILYGVNKENPTNIMDYAELNGQFVLASSQAVRIEHRVSADGNYGHAMGFTGPTSNEVYMQATFTKIA